MECQVCFSEYNSNDHRPKSLPCGHSICDSCVKENLRAKNGKMNCPFCRTACGTGVKTSDDFPTTFALLNLLDTGEHKCASNALSPKEKEKKIFQRKKQVESNNMDAHISSCNENLQKLLQAKGTQESAIQNIRLGKKKLLEDYQQEQNKLDEAEKKATSTKDQLDGTVAEGNNIVKGLEALKDRGQSASSLLGLNMATQDVQRYNTASQEWVGARVNSILNETHLIQENASNPEQSVSQGVQCQRKFSVGESYYSCLQCRTKYSIALCGSCFVNSAHLNHEVEIRQSAGSGGFCDCGLSQMWKREPTCSKHLRVDRATTQAFDVRLQSSAKCKEIFFEGENCYTCLDCRTKWGVIMCGTCFLNSSHKGHRYEVHTASGNGAFCDCGRKDVWKMGNTCKIHN